MNFQSPEDRRPLAAEYVLGTLSDSDRTKFERALATDPELQFEVDRWTAVLGNMLDAVDEVQPPSSVWARIDQALPAFQGSVTPIRPAARRWAIPIAIAAALAIGVLLWQLDRVGPASGPADAIVDQPAAHQQTEGPGDVDVARETLEDKIWAEADMTEAQRTAQNVQDANEATQPGDVDADDFESATEDSPTADRGRTQIADSARPDDPIQPGLSGRDAEPGAVPSQVPGSADDVIGRRRVARLTTAASREGWVVEVDPATRSATVTAVDPEQINPGNSLQLWAVPAGDGVPESLGLIRDSGRDMLALTDDQLLAVAASDALAVSLERLGGSSQGRPVGPIVYTGSLTPPSG